MEKWCVACGENNNSYFQIPSNLHTKSKIDNIIKKHLLALAGHPGAEETERSIAQHFHWPKLQESVRRYYCGQKKWDIKFLSVLKNSMYSSFIVIFLTLF
jgi:hypothetical protein